MRRKPPAKLIEKANDASKLARGRRIYEAFSKTPEGAQSIAVSEEFSAKWRAELAEMEKSK